MPGINKIIKSKTFWSIIITVFVINTVVNANKEYNKDLLDDYYAVADTTTIPEEEVTISELTIRDSLVIFAEDLLGKAYVYGRSGPEGFDCSGFIYHVFKKFDIKLPRSSKYQAKEGNLINRDDVKKGDLLFFKSPSPNNPNIGHVGIVLENDEGNIKFIHSSTGRGVVIDSLGSKHYGKRFMEARRVITTE